MTAECNTAQEAPVPTLPHSEPLGAPGSGPGGPSNPPLTCEHGEGGQGALAADVEEHGPVRAAPELSIDPEPLQGDGGAGGVGLQCVCAAQVCGRAHTHVGPQQLSPHLYRGCLQACAGGGVPQHPGMCPYGVGVCPYMCVGQCVPPAHACTRVVCSHVCMCACICIFPAHLQSRGCLCVCTCTQVCEHTSVFPAAWHTCKGRVLVCLYMHASV